MLSECIDPEKHFRSWEWIEDLLDYKCLICDAPVPIRIKMSKW